MCSAFVSDQAWEPCQDVGGLRLHGVIQLPEYIGFAHFQPRVQLIGALLGLKENLDGRNQPFLFNEAANAIPKFGEILDWIALLPWMQHRVNSFVEQRRGHSREPRRSKTMNVTQEHPRDVPYCNPIDHRGATKMGLCPTLL